MGVGGGGRREGTLSFPWGFTLPKVAGFPLDGDKLVDYVRVSVLWCVCTREGEKGGGEGEGGAGENIRCTDVSWVLDLMRCEMPRLRAGRGYYIQSARILYNYSKKPIIAPPKPHIHIHVDVHVHVHVPFRP